MRYIDQHMHSSYSFDAKAEFEEYLNNTENKIVTTEHLDFADPSYNYKDRPLDLEGYVKEIDALNKVYDNRLLKGVEVGWSASQQDRILEVLNSIDFDLVLLSIHSSGTYDYMDQTVTIESRPEVLVPIYLENLYKGLEAMHEHVNVLAHFDYGFRITSISTDDLEKYGKDKLIDLFKLMIKHDISFEVNTGSIAYHDNQHLYEYAITLYLALGGSNFTMGSDAHQYWDYQKIFMETVVFLKDLGVKELTYYIQKKPYKVSISDL